jgi:type IV secretory pathway TrbD component
MSLEYERRMTKVHKSLMEIKTMGGVERNLFILNLTAFGIFVMGLHMIAFIAISVISHYVLVKVTKKDPFTRLIYLHFSKQCDRYDPWPHAVQKRNLRPEGYGRGALC